MAKVDQASRRGHIVDGDTHRQNTASRAKASGSSLLAQARTRAWNSSPQMVQLKAALTEAGKMAGSERHWAELQTQLRACLPTDERVKSLGMAIGDAVELADKAAADKDGDTYRLAMRRLWTAVNFIDF